MMVAAWLLALVLAAAGALTAAAQLRGRNVVAGATQVLAAVLLAPPIMWLCLRTAGADGAGAAVLLPVAVIVTAAVLGALGERLRMGASLLVSGLLASVVALLLTRGVGLTVPLRLGGDALVDRAGAALHVLAGAVALAGLWVAGARGGRYSRRGSLAALHGAQPALLMAAVLLRWAGLCALAAAWAARGAAELALLASLLAGAAGGVGAWLAAAGSALERRGLRPELSARGVVAGAVALAAGAGVIPPALALAVGALAGAASVGLQRVMLARGLDDAVGAVSVHLGGGVLGLLALGAWNGASGDGSLVVELAGAGIMLAGGLALGGLLFGVLEGVGLLRATAAERVGLSVADHQALPEGWTLAEVQAESAVRRAGEPVVLFAELLLQPGGTVVRANPMASAVFGYAERELEGMAVERLLADGERALLGRRAQGPAWREGTGVRQSGEEFALELRLDEAEQGGVSHITASVRDVSREREPEQGLGALVREVRQRYERELSAAGVSRRSGLAEDDEFPDCRIAAHYPQRPTAAAALSWLEYLWTSDRETLTFVLADFSGRTDQPALLAGRRRLDSHLHGLFLGNFRHPPERQIANLAEVLGQLTVDVGRRNLRLALTLCNVNLKNGDLAMLSAGRRTPVLHGSAGGRHQLKGGGVALGAGPPVQSHQLSGRLAVGDLLVLPATGLMDPFRSAEQSFTARQLGALVEHGKPATVVLERVVSRARQARPGDDRAVLVFKRSR